MTRHYYAFQYRYGALTTTDCGCHPGARSKACGDVHVFDSLAERNDWVRQGSPYTSEPGFREILSSKAAHSHYFGAGWEVEPGIWAFVDQYQRDAREGR